MPEYQLQIKQVVDYPRCRIYREFIHKLINDRSIRINGGSGLFHFTVLCSYANFRTSYRRIDGISYTVSPGEWVCTVKELSCWFRTRFHRQALSMLDTLQKQHLISYTLLGRGNVVKYKILHWARHNSALEYNAPCQKDTGFFFLPVSVALELVSSARCSEMDIVLDLWVSAVYNDTQVQGSEVGPVAYFRNGTGNPLVSYTELSCRWGLSRATVCRILKKLDGLGYISTVRKEMEQETNEQCLLMQEDYLQFVQQIGSREAITRRFFLIFEYEPWSNTKRSDEEGEAINALQSAVHTATNYLRQCGNEVIVPENWDEFTVDVLYNLLCRNESAVKPLSVRAQEVVAEYLAKGRDSEIDHIPATEFCAPKSIDFTHGHHICIDGLYYAYLLVPSDGYKTQVPAGWLSLIVNAGDGIDMDMFLSRQPKETIIQKVGQQLRINRSKIKDASDTNTDFDDIDGAIRSGYFLKEGLANNEDFYYLNLLITITASNEEDLEWKVSEMKKLLLSQDMNACTCHFREEQAFLSALPLVAMEKKLYERGKRNLLTGGAASCYPFTSYEMCDDNGILLGVNKYNSSLIIVDIFNSAVYKNANMSILGTSGAGKTFTMQLMALRMRRKNIPIFIVAPLKGHEFHRACSNVGGSFIQISPASPHCINVMEIRRVDRSVNEILDGPGIQLSELAAKIQQLHIFFSLLIPDMSHEERQLLDEALVRTYNTKGITHDNASLEDPAQPGQYREMPVLGDLYEILKTSKETMRMAHILNRLVNGSASTFNKQTNVRLDNKYTVLDISSLTGDLLTVGMFVALDFVWDRAKADRTEEKAIFIDECWQLLSGAGAAGVRLAGDFLLEIAKTIRGYGGASIFASQDLADFFDLDGGRFGKGIINNSKTKIILNLEDDEAQRVQEALHLSDAETMEITHFERGHGLISTNNNNIMVEFKASPLEKDLITTDRRELREIVERKRREQSTSAEQQI